MKRRPQAAQTRKGAHRQGFNARIFDQADQRHLQRLERSDRKSCPRQRHMRGRVRDAGAKQLRQRASRHAAEHRRNAHDAAGDVDAPRKLPARRRHRAAQDRRPAPQGRRVGFQDPFAAGEGQRAGRLLQHLRGKPIFQREEGAAARAVAAGVFEPGGDEGLEAGSCRRPAGSCRCGSPPPRPIPAPRARAAPSRATTARYRPPRAAVAAHAGSACRQASAACEPAPRQISAMAWAKSASSLSDSSDFRSAAHPPERELAFRAGIDEGKLQRALRPSIELGILRRRPKSPPSNRGTGRARCRGGGSGDAGV